MAQLPLQTLSLHLRLPEAGHSNVLLSEGLPNTNHSFDLWLDQTDECILACSNEVSLLVLQCVLLKGTQVAHLLVESSPQQSQAYHPFALQFLCHCQSLLEIVGVLIE